MAERSGRQSERVVFRGLRGEEANALDRRKSRRVHAGGCASFWSWGVVGSTAAVGALTLGVLVLFALIVVGALLVAQRRLHRSAFGFLAGVGTLLLYVAWLNRSGPGFTCWRSATASGCVEHLNPLPWLFVGGLLVIGGIVAYARRA
jgi:hypothetical protein